MVDPIEMTPREVVDKLNEHIVGQDQAKRAVAIALRNRWRWSQLDPEMRKEVIPKNILMIGPTGVGKTEITRRLAKLTGAPFVKVEATKYTEVGYYGRDVESIVRDLVDVATNLVKAEKRTEIESEAEERVEERLLEMLVPSPEWDPDDEQREETEQRHERTVEKFRVMLREGQLEGRRVELTIDRRQSPVQILGAMGTGMEQMEMDLQNMLERVIPNQSNDREVTVADARKILLEQEIENLLDKDVINEESVRLASERGIVFIDEIDKVAGPDGDAKSVDVSRQGVQRDLLPIVEGTTVQTRQGPVATEHMLFIAAGAFHRSKPSDLMPELQGRFPIRVELQDLTRDDFLRILTEPTSSITKQYQALLGTEKVSIEFTEDGLEELADLAYQVNQTTQNIGARRLHTILERLLEELSYHASDMPNQTVTVNREYVRGQLADVVKDEDLSRFIL